MDNQLQDREEWLTTLRELRSLGLGDEIGVPSFVLCGSAARKPAVMSAISGLSFPREYASNQIPIEFEFCRALDCGIRASIRLPLGEAAFSSEMREIFKSTREYSTDGLTNILRVISTESSKLRTQLQTSNHPANTTIRIEIYSPNQRDLKVIDLPSWGLPGCDMASSHTEKQAVPSINNPHNIILAIDVANFNETSQKGMELAKTIDPDGIRTFAVVAMSRAILSDEYLSSNTNRLEGLNRKLRLGWCILRCWNSGSPISENDFSKLSGWPTFSVTQLGKESIRLCLEDLMLRHFLNHLPSILTNLETRLTTSSRKLQGSSQIQDTTPGDALALSTMRKDFALLITAAVGGDYSDPFFRDTKLPASICKKRLRSNIQCVLSLFEEKMQQQKYCPSDESSGLDDANKMRRMMHLGWNSGLPGMLSPIAVSELLVLRCQPLKKIVHKTATDVICCVRDCIELILDHVRQAASVKEISITVETALETVINDFRDKVDELLRPYCSIHPLVYNPNVTQHVWSMQESRRKDRTEAQTPADRKTKAGYFKATRTADCPEPPTTSDIRGALCRQANELAHDYTRAYYEDALQGLISNFGLYAVEECLLSRIMTISDFKQTPGVSDELCHHIGNEFANMASRSKSQSEYGDRLKSAIETLRCVQACQSAPSVDEFSCTTEEGMDTPTSDTQTDSDCVPLDQYDNDDSYNLLDLVI